MIKRRISPFQGQKVVKMWLFCQILSNLMFFGQNLDFPKITKIPKGLGKIMQIMSNLAQTIHRVSSKDPSTIFLIFWFFLEIMPFFSEKSRFFTKIAVFLYKMGQKSRKNQNIKKMVDGSLELTLCMVWAKFDMICIIFPRSLGILVIFGKSRFCPKNIKFDKISKLCHIFTTFWPWKWDILLLIIKPNWNIGF